MWKTPTREQAKTILLACRAWTDREIEGLDAKQLTTPTVLGDGTWSIKDLLGHLAAWEERALVVAGVRPSPASSLSFASADDFNAHHLALRRSWSLPKVRRNYVSVRSSLVSAIDGMTDDEWFRKVSVANGTSALALVLARLLTGARHGYFAHDLAHGRDLEEAVRSLKGE